MHAHRLCSWHSVLPVQFATSAAKLSSIGHKSNHFLFFHWLRLAPKGLLSLWATMLSCTQTKEEGGWILEERQWFTGLGHHWHGLTSLERQVWTGCLVERAGLLQYFLVEVELHYTGEQVRLHRHGEAQTGSPLISLLQLVCETWPYVNKQING